MIVKLGLLAAAIVVATIPTLAADKYQTDIGPTPKTGREGPNVQGRGAIRGTLDGTTFTIQGQFAGLSTPATQARLHIGNVTGGGGPSIGNLKLPEAQSGEISGTFQLTAEQVTGLKVGKLYVILDSRSAPKGNLWGWFQPAHVTVPEGVPQMNEWYIPDILDHRPVAAIDKNKN